MGSGKTCRVGKEISLVESTSSCAEILFEGLHLKLIVMDHIHHITILLRLQEDNGQLGRRPPLPPQVVEATPGVDEQGACQHD